jgi:O-antigen/teichoic acid export membrane protein
MVVGNRRAAGGKPAEGLNTRERSVRADESTPLQNSAPLRGGASATALADVSAHQRERVLSGMRWSVWLSSVALPCGAAINLLLARVSPETIGTYGLLSVYIGFIVAFLYFGGDALVIKFIPGCAPSGRASFIASYLAVVFALLIIWLAFAWLCPAALALVLGRQTDPRFNFILLCLAPVPILFYVVVAALKGMLEIRLAQMLAKLLTVISIAAYGFIFVIARPILAHHAAAVIWGVFLSLTGVLALVGTVRIFQLCGPPRLRFHLPAGFWRYAVDAQMVGIVSFFADRLDYVLLLNLGGLALLGRYVAIMAVAATVPLMNSLFMDTLLPSLTNMIASRNHPGAGQVFMLHMRILFLITVAGGCGLMLLAGPATELMGPQYRSVKDLIVLMTMFQSIASPGAYGAAVLSSMSLQRRILWSIGLQVALFVCLFVATWPRWNLTGAVVAYGSALTISYATLMAITLKTASFIPSIGGLWFKAAVAQIVVAAVALQWAPLSPIVAPIIWTAALIFFVWISDYHISELKLLTRMFMPGSAALSGTSQKISLDELIQRS